MREANMAFKELCEENRRNEQEAKQRSLEADRRLEKLEKKFDRLGIQVGGIDDNQGHHAEQFFQDVFRKKLEFGEVKYDEMVPNLAYKGKKDEIEFDIALVNGESVALIEVKNRIHPDFVKILAEERVEKFREFFHEFDNYDVYLGIAGFSFSDEVLDRASSYGIGIIKQVGEGVEIKANNLKAY
jgi:ribosomal protein L31